ncbi:MAG: hypothetical protein HRT71_19480 [Flavobacteriales bacterium]|nr:hypothetical protein [Flavobacteriales bacterium]
MKIPCEECGTMILPITAERTGGFCMPCQGENKYKEWTKESERNRGKDREFLVALKHQEWVYTTFEKLVPRSVNLKKVSIIYHKFDVLLGHKDQSMFIIHDNENGGLYNNEIIKYNLYRINDKIIDLLNKCNNTEKLAHDISVRDQDFGSFTGPCSKEELENLKEQSQKEEFLEYKEFLPILKNLCEDCTLNEKYLFYMQITEFQELK